MPNLCLRASTNGGPPWRSIRSATSNACSVLNRAARTSLVWRWRAMVITASASPTAFAPAPKRLAKFSPRWGCGRLPSRRRGGPALAGRGRPALHRIVRSVPEITGVTSRPDCALRATTTLGQGYNNHHMKHWGNRYENSIDSALPRGSGLLRTAKFATGHEGHEHAGTRHVANGRARFWRRRGSEFACHAFHGRSSHGDGRAYEDDRAPHSATGRCDEGSASRGIGAGRDGKIQGLPCRAQRRI